MSVAEWYPAAAIGDGRRAAAGIRGQLAEAPWDYLPTDTEPVAEPAALRFRSALDEAVPLVVHLCLVGAVHDEGHGLGERELGPGPQAIPAWVT